MTGERKSERDSIKNQVRRQLEEQKEINRSLYNGFISHSSAYKRALELNQVDLEDLDRIQTRPSGIYPSLQDHQGFVSLEVKNERFILCVRHVAGHQYGGSWSDEIMAVCATNAEHNRECGAGTSLISVIPDEYHSAIINHIKEES